MIDAKVRTLISLADTKSYTETARELNLTQPAVSHHIKQLEEEYNIKIFNRVKNKLKLTPEGDILLKYAHRILGLSDGARNAIEDCKNNVNHISIGVTQTISEIFIPQIIAMYCNEHVNTTVNISTDSIKKIQDKLRHYELDIAVVEGSLPSPDFTSTLLDTDSLVLITSPEHKLAGKASVTLADIKDETFIMRTKKSGTRALIDSFLNAQFESIKNLRVSIELDNATMIKELVALNLGISIMAKSVCLDDARRGRLAIIPIENSNMVRDINMVTHRDFAHPELLTELAEIYHAMKEQPPAWEGNI
ncbi:MAG: LysR family transcriptional regulator [Eubacteriales bacterium]